MKSIRGNYVDTLYNLGSTLDYLTSLSGGQEEEKLLEALSEMKFASQALRQYADEIFQMRARIPYPPYPKSLVIDDRIVDIRYLFEGLAGHIEAGYYGKIASLVGSIDHTFDGLEYSLGEVSHACRQ